MAAVASVRNFGEAIVLSSVVFAGCVHEHAPAASVAVESHLPAAIDVANGTLLQECRIVGTGERSPSFGRAARFEVFAARESTTPSLLVHTPSAVHVAWDRFPVGPLDRGRARVELGGQQHVRFVGWSELHGRVFSTKRRMYAKPGHLWARGGSPIEMTAVENGFALALVQTPFVAPKTLAVRGACDDVAYEPKVSDVLSDAHPRRKALVNGGASLRLYEQPRGTPFLTLELELGHAQLEMLERRDGFVRVAFEDQYVAFDAWVPESEVTDAPTSGEGYGYGHGRSSDGIIVEPLHGTVLRDAQLFVGEQPAALRGAIVEKNAEVYYDFNKAISMGATVVVPFEFRDLLIGAPLGQRLWVAKDAIAPEN